MIALLANSHAPILSSYARMYLLKHFPPLSINSCYQKKMCPHSLLPAKWGTESKNTCHLHGEWAAFTEAVLLKICCYQKSAACASLGLFRCLAAGNSSGPAKWLDERLHPLDFKNIPWRLHFLAKWPCDLGWFISSAPGMRNHKSSWDRLSTSSRSVYLFLNTKQDVWKDTLSLQISEMKEWSFFEPYS